MKKSRNLLILVIVLVLLGGAYALISLKKPASSDSGTDSQKIKLSVIDSKKIVSASLNSKNGSLVLEKSGDNWVSKSDTSIKLDQAKAGVIITSFANIYAEKVVDEKPTDLSEYGLKDPAVTAAATLDDGSSISLNIGDKVPGGQAYYMMMKGDPKLYTMSSTDGDPYTYTLSDLRDKTVLNFSTDSINSMKITSGDKVMEFRRIPGDAQQLETTGYGPWIMDKPYKGQYNANSSAVQSIIDSLGGMSINRFVDDNPADLSKYGLDKPSRQMELLGSSGSFKIFIGNDADSDDIYFMTGSSKSVYTMAKSLGDIFKQSTFDLINKAPISTDIKYVNQITIESQGKKDVIDVTRTTTPAATQGGAPTVTQTYKVNGKDADSAKVEDFYKKLTAINIDAESDKAVADNSEVKMTFALGNGLNGQTVISYSPYNSDFYGVFINGACDFLVSKSQVQGVLTSLQDLTK